MRAASCDLEPTATADVFSDHESHMEKLVRQGQVETPLVIAAERFQRNALQASGSNVGVRLELLANADVLSVHGSHLEKLMSEERWNRLRQTKVTSRTQKFLECTTAQVVAVPDTGCAKRPVELRGFDDNIQHSHQK